MVALISFFIIVTVWLLVARLATVALTMTGLSREAARFQARSALTGTGFTTSEAEEVVSHPVRRRIVTVLMVVGSGGFVTAIAALLVTFTGVSGTADGLRRAGVLLVGLAVLLFLARSQTADRWLSRVLERLLRRWSRLEQRDHVSLLRLKENWMVAELEVEPRDWLAGRTLADLDLPHEGILVLGIERADGRYLGAPKGSTEIHAGDVLILYGRQDVLDSLDVRPQGDPGEREHAQKLADIRRQVEEEFRRDQVAERREQS